jgi:hypothetical protein
MVGEKRFAAPPSHSSKTIGTARKLFYFKGTIPFHEKEITDWRSGTADHSGGYRYGAHYQP